ncbi:MAG TPA: hypothetical protein VNQ48_03830 [Microbacteriaceae bacterium]|nr:hypothetical protein [Microbacteriaceae bacterium]
MPLARATLTAAAAIAVILSLSGCTQLNTFLHEQFPDTFGPDRGASGSVTAPVAAHTKYLVVGDCFDFEFPHADDPGETDDPTRVIIKPCTDDHIFEVIGQGEVDLVDEKTLGLDVAISTQCADPFADWAAAAPEGVRTDQEFLVRQEKIGERTTKLYTCIAAQQKL